MKVIFATLLIVGFAAALSPKTIINNLKTQLQSDVQTIKTHTKSLVQQVKTHAQEDVAAIVKNPFAGLGKLIKNLSNDAKDVVTSTVTDTNQVNDHIQAAITQLKEVDASKYLPILDTLKEQLKGDAKDAKATVQELLKQALGHVGDDVKALLTKPIDASKIIQDNWNTDFNKFVTEGQKYVATVQQQVQEALEKLQQVDQ
ncbi:uncharacterized protein PF3D7_1120000 [Halyomorpha halys]|uniref:uncharacterized protein PF3D7_1120000 n=1 Tax=Halyomorpha halys TaxID=286706 RepID=UPI0006D4D1A1|nr:uncharacterized protein LOC106682756 [Halyomorpha halys]